MVPGYLPESQLLVRGLQGIDFVAYDLVEVSPPYDTRGATTCLLAANLVYEFISLLALSRQETYVLLKMTT